MKKRKNNKFCRREGENLEFFSEKKFLKKSRSLLTPGEHGSDKGKNSDFAVILRTKQKIKRYFSIHEKQFKLIYKKISKNFFFTEELIIFLERRLDNIIYRMNFSISRKNSRQMIIHGFVFVNFKKKVFPSMIISPGDSIFVNNFLKNNYFYNCKKFFNFNWYYSNYFERKAIFISLPINFKFKLEKSIVLDMYK